MRREFETLHRTHMRIRFALLPYSNLYYRIPLLDECISQRVVENRQIVANARANLPTWQPAVSSATDSPALLLCVCQDCTRRQISSSRKSYLLSLCITIHGRYLSHTLKHIYLISSR